MLEGVRPEDLGIGRLFERVRDAVIVAEAKTERIVLWNPAAERVFGYSVPEALGMRVEALVPRHLKARHRAGVAFYGETGRGRYIDSHALLDLPAVRKDGEEIRVELSLNPIGPVDDAEGEANGEGRFVLAIAREVTERKRAEEALRESEERLRDLAEAAFEGILITDGGQILHSNRVLLEMLGYERREALGRSVLKFIAPGYRDLVQRNILSGIEEPYEILGLRKDGTTLELEVRGRAFSYGGREVRVSAIRDVSDRKRAEEARSRLAAIVESSDDAIIGKTLEGTITSWNSGAQSIYGYSAEEVLGRSINILAPPDLSEEIPAILERIRRGERVDHYETARVRKDGTRIYVSITVSPVRNSVGNVVRASTVARDVTERKEAEEKIRRLNETLEEQVAERTAQLLDRERRLKDLVGKLVAAQEEERRRVAYEVHDGPTQVAVACHQHLQDFARKHPPGSTAGEGKLDRALELARLTVKETRHVIEGLRPTALDDFGLAAAVRLRIEELRKEGWEIGYEEDLGGERLNPEVETTLYRIAQEALTNVRKHAGIKGARVTLTRLKGKVRLEVGDEGHGFDPSLPTKRGNGPGERVGLPGMRERVSLLGGELEIKSTPGVGTTVVAEVPASKPAAAPEKTKGGRA